MGCAGNGAELDVKNVNDLRAQLEESTPVGMRREEVISYLEDHSVPHASYEDRNSIGAKFSGRRGLITRLDFSVEFLFDEQGKLSELTIEEIRTGP